MIAAVETADELRVLATDAKSLPSADRLLITRAADELEAAGRGLLAARTELAESIARRMALVERVAEAEHAARRVHLSPWHLYWSGASWRS
jgi:hypothetical protein